MGSLSTLFGPKVLEEHTSRFSGRIRLMQGWGHKYIATGILTQSGGVVADVWRPVLRKMSNVKCQMSNILILGLGAGTLAGLFTDRYHPAKIVGVEIDSIMLDLGYRHFGLDTIPNLQIINRDANSYVQKTKGKFDVVFVDLYLGDQLPQFVYSEKFLKKLQKLGRTVVFNHLFYDEVKKSRAKNLVMSLKPLFSHIELVRALTNLMIISSN